MKISSISGRTAKLCVAGAAMIVLALGIGAVGQSSTSAGIASGVRGGLPKWGLVDYEQKGCFDVNIDSTYFGIWLTGSWRRPIEVGLSDLPKNARYTTSYAPIDPGTSDGRGSLAYVRLQLDSLPAVGKYDATLWRPMAIAPSQFRSC